MTDGSDGIEAEPETEPEPDDEERGRELMVAGAAAILAGVDAGAAAWVETRVRRVADAWGRLSDDDYDAVLRSARAAGAAGAARVHDALEELFATDPAVQRSTPLEILRSLRREATAVLADAGIPSIERDPFEARAFPDDIYGIVLLSANELGDDELGAALVAWGLGKSRVLRSRGDAATG